MIAKYEELATAYKPIETDHPLPSQEQKRLNMPFAYRAPIRPLPFFFAFLGAPLLVTLLTFWALVPIGALIFGFPFYVLTGLPLLLAAVGKLHLKFWSFALLGLLGHGIVCAAWGLWILVHFEQFDYFRIHALFGAAFAPLWSGTFAILYRAFAKINTDYSSIIERNDDV